MQNNNTSFSFGKNWQDFIEFYLTPERVSIAKQHIAKFLEVPDFKGRSFLDVGCGSGLSSLAAHELGAARIVSFDLDPDAVKTTQKLRELAGNPAHWTIRQGSILDESFCKSIETADIVYSWGVLHHTGQMWNAFANTARLVSEHGLLYVALYTTLPKSGYWLWVKQRYNRTSTVGKRIMEIVFMLMHSCKLLLFDFQNPLRHIRRYEQRRGMSYRTDVRDWLGGYPYEHAKIEEVLRFARKRLNLELINIKTGEANTEYVFIPKRSAADCLAPGA